jgi:hypothetical protein
MAAEIRTRPHCAVCGGDIEWRIHSQPPYLGYWTHPQRPPFGDAHTARPAATMRTWPRFAIGQHVRVLGENLCGTVATRFESIKGNWAYGVLYDDHEIDLPIGRSGHSFAEVELVSLDLDQIEEA